ncbi:polyprenyl synthetase family protein [Nocardia sp. ET3-3]|uniref:Polyprenyl synthetase family protein n=1 Tax=Nocardia terrae TaxID=2675851 RepID=A0A7K1V4G4_9NOCA|nr:polyprenyl synthetase family protein [Nocardia terrae]MVU81381.1 polyprenyl synthetase family protein [Nocardia terrae]
MSSSTAADPAFYGRDTVRGGGIGSGDHAAHLLRRARRRTGPLMRAAIDTLPGELRVMAGYHLGWCDAEGTAVAEETGGGWWPALVLAAAAAAGGPTDAALRAAAAVELVHHFTLIHDEATDGDELRRGRPTVWRLWGVEDAVLVGDALHGLAVWTLAAAPAAGLGAIAHLEDAVIEICLNRHRDRAEAAGPVASLDEFRETLRHRSAPLLGCACAMGALCAGASAAGVAEMDRFGREIGVAFELWHRPPARAAAFIARAGGEPWARAECRRQLRSASTMLARRHAEDLLTLANCAICRDYS